MLSFVNPATDCCPSVAHYEIRNGKDAVVIEYLIKYALRYFYLWCLVFDNHFRFKACVVEHSVATQLFATATDFHFVGKQFGRVVLLLDEEVDKALPHFLLGSYCHVLSSKYIKNFILQLVRLLCQLQQLSLWLS